MFFVFIFLAALAAVYGVCVMLIRSGSRFYAVWFLLAAFFLLLAMRGTFPKGLRRVLIALLIAFAAVVAVTWGCILTAFPASGEAGLDYIVVLGAQIRDTEPGTILKYRLDTAYDYLEKNPATVCIVSGGQGTNEPDTEAAVMCAYLTGRGIPADRILCEDTSKNTSQNLENSGKMIDISKDKVGIVTNNFHVFRAVHIAKKKGYRHVCGIAAPSTAFYLPNNMLRESCGIIKDLAVGNM